MAISGPGLARRFPVSIMDVCRLGRAGGSIPEGCEATEFQQKVAGEIVKELRARLFPQKRRSGVFHSTASGSLSGGEAQRIRLATQIGAGLVGVLYILDEPSIGLHQRDNDRLLHTLEGLRDLGNSVLVVEHDEETIRRADYLIDLGPGAGVRGGELVACGTVAEVMANPQSLTGRYLKGDLAIPIPRRRGKPVGDKGWLTVVGARENNLKSIDVRSRSGRHMRDGVSGWAKAPWWTTSCGAPAMLDRCCERRACTPASKASRT